MHLYFWNIGGNRKRKPQGYLEGVAEALNTMFMRGADLIAVCEVSAKSMESLGTLTEDFIISKSLTEKVGRASWDIGIFWNPGLVDVRVTEPALGREDGRTIRAAQRMEVSFCNDLEAGFWLYVLHWQGRMFSAGRDQRCNAAATLWERIRKELRQDERVVVLGDFNDEPFDSPIAKHLHARRDPRAVLSLPQESLFNPSWAFLAPPSKFLLSPFGSMSYRVAETHSHLIDQALVSHHYLNDDASRLTFAVDYNNYPPAGLSDHHPILLRHS